MRLMKHKNYNSEFPEQFNWYIADSHLASKIAEEMKRLILSDLETEERNLVPGLRKALNVFARNLTVD